MRRNNLKKIILVFIILICMTGCIKRDQLENVTIYTTAYPIEYITQKLYGENSNVKSIYPDGIIIDDYTLTDKQIKDYSKSSIYIYNGLSKEKNYVVPLFKNNKNIKIIDSSKTIEYENGIEELWLNPSNLLMMAKNIKNGFNEYIENHYLLESIDKNYEEMYLEISNLDAKISLMVENANNKTIVVSNDLFKYLEKYNINVISLDPDTVTDKTINQVNNLIDSGIVRYIYTKQNEKVSEAVNSIVTNKKIETISLHTISNITPEERNAKKDYISLMNENIELLKKELIH